MTQPVHTNTNSTLAGGTPSPQANNNANTNAGNGNAGHNPGNGNANHNGGNGNANNAGGSGNKPANANKAPDKAHDAPKHEPEKPAKAEKGK
jgi:hypothetical protein